MKTTDGYKNPDEALEYFKHIKQLCEESPSKESSELGHLLFFIASVHRDKKELDEAKSNYLRAIEYFSKSTANYSKELGYIYNDLSLILIKNKDETGSQYYMEGHKLLQESVLHMLGIVDETAETLGEDHIEMAPLYCDIGITLMTLNKFGPSKEYMEKAYKIFQEHYGDGHPICYDLKTRLETAALLEAE